MTRKIGNTDFRLYDKQYTSRCGPLSQNIFVAPEKAAQSTVGVI